MGSGGIVSGYNLILLVTDGRLQNFRTLGQLLLGEKPSSPSNISEWGVKRGGGGICSRVQSYYFGTCGPHAKFQNTSTAPSRRIWLGVLVVLVLLPLVTAQNKVNSQVSPEMGVFSIVMPIIMLTISCMIYATINRWSQLVLLAYVWILLMNYHLMLKPYIP